jgi:hypothetical protein
MAEWRKPRLRLGDKDADTDDVFLRFLIRISRGPSLGVQLLNQNLRFLGKTG